jgi:hypothetical protein
MQAVPLVFIGGLVGFAVAEKARVRDWWSARTVFVRLCSSVCPPGVIRVSSAEFSSRRGHAVR